MKKQRTFHIDQDLNEMLNTLAEESNASVSTVLNNLLRSTLKKDTTKIVAHHNGFLSGIRHRVQFCKSDESILHEIAKRKGHSIVKEIRFRVSASMANPAFDIIETNAIDKARLSLDKLGNLLNQALAHRHIYPSGVDDVLKSKIGELHNKVDTLSMAFFNVTLKTLERIR